MTPAPQDGHEVIEDRTFTGYARFTCNTCAVTIVDKPYFTQAQWGKLTYEFAQQHPISRREVKQ